MTILLVIASGLAAAGGFLLLSQATSGVGIMALACLLAIWARIEQAARHHRELKQWLQSHLPVVPPASTPQAGA